MKIKSTIDKRMKEGRGECNEINGMKRKQKEKQNSYKKLYSHAASKD